MKKKRRGKKWIVLFILLLLIGAAVCFVWIVGPEKIIGQTGEKAELPDTQEVSVGTIRVTTEGNGIIEPEKKTSFAADYTVEIESVEVENGDMVAEGDLIATVNGESVKLQIRDVENRLSELNTAIANMDKSGASTVAAPVSGRVKRIFAREGEILSDVVEKHGGIMELSADGKLKAEFTSSEELGLSSSVTVSFSDYEEEGTIVSVNENRYIVTISDDSEYQVDTPADILDENGNKLGTGTLQTNVPYLVDAQYGICDELNVSVGDYVYSGGTLLYRTDDSYNADYIDLVGQREEALEDLRALRALRDEPEFLAKESGIVADIAIAEHQTVTEGFAMYSVISTDSYWLKAGIDELDIAGVAAGQDVAVVFDAFDEEEYEGKVEKVSALGTNNGGTTTYTVTISIQGVDKIKPGMSATAKITLDEKEGVLLVPVDAVQSIDGEKYVTIVSADQTEQVRVTLGLVNNTVAEVTEGLSEGTKVAVETSDGMEDLFRMMRRQGGRSND